MSSFAGKGKTKAFKLLKDKARYVRGFMALGVSWDINDELFNVLEGFVCDLYGTKGRVNSVDLLRYQLHCVKGGNVGQNHYPRVDHHISFTYHEQTTKREYGEGL